jgi:hypothetical protein
MRDAYCVKMVTLMTPCLAIVRHGPTPTDEPSAIFARRPLDRSRPALNAARWKPVRSDRRLCRGKLRQRAIAFRSVWSLTQLLSPFIWRSQLDIVLDLVPYRVADDCEVQPDTVVLPRARPPGPDGRTPFAPRELIVEVATP